jgi:hypothetical protein
MQARYEQQELKRKRKWKMASLLSLTAGAKRGLRPNFCGFLAMRFDK